MELPRFSELKKEAGLTVVGGGMIAFGYWLRRQHLGFPERETWDEEHFVRNARHYLTSGLDLNDHPPLGKLLIAVGMKLFGDNTFGWRVMPFVAGALAIVLAYGLGAELFKSWKAGWIAAALVATDGFFIAYSRAALLDGILAALMLASAWALVRATTPARVFLACALIGLAASIKFTGVTMLGAVFVLTVVVQQAPRWSVVGVLISFGVYYVCFAIGLSLLHLPTGPAAVLKATRGLVNYHLALTTMAHPYTSYWYTWFLPVKPILMHYEQTGGWARAMTTLGNPLLWWSGTAAMTLSLWAVARRSLAALRARARGGVGTRESGFFAQHPRAVGMLVLFWALPLAPWILTRRDSYINHYLPSYGFVLILLAGMLAWLYQRRATLGLAALIVVAEVSVFYAPVWAKLPLTPAAYVQRLFIKSWR